MDSSIVPKVFVIGFQKTGTTSLDLALQRLGFTVLGVDKNLLKFTSKTELHHYIKTTLETYDAVQDLPWPLYYKDLHEIYPNARFILTIRPSEEWFRSVVKFFGSIRIPFHQKIYKVPCAEGYETQYRAIYDQHNQEVLAYFKSKTNFLVMEQGKNFDYSTLCKFLDIEQISLEKFPHGRNNGKRVLPNFKWYRDLRSIYWNYKKGY